MTNIKNMLENVNAFVGFSNFFTSTNVINFEIMKDNLKSL